MDIISLGRFSVFKKGCYCVALFILIAIDVLLFNFKFLTFGTKNPAFIFSRDETIEKNVVFNLQSTVKLTA